MLGTKMNDVSYAIGSLISFTIAFHHSLFHMLLFTLFYL